MIALPLAVEPLELDMHVGAEDFQAISQDQTEIRRSPIVASLFHSNEECDHATEDVFGSVANPGSASVISHGLETAVQECALSEGIEFELVKSGYPMQHVRCHCSEAVIRLSGCVRRYFYLQVAIEIARRLARGRTIVSEIEVVPCSHDES